MTRALVLSAGGMFGAWQAGAWSVLCRYFDPDLVVGASVGSLNGWAIASGCAPQWLVERWSRRQVPARTIRELYREFEPKIRYALVVTEAPRLRAKICEWPGLTERHLVASCAVPPVLWPQRIDRRWCADGGIAAATPVQAAWDLGASEVLALNAMAGCRFAFRSHRPNEPATSDSLLELRPSAILGGAVGMLRWNERSVRQWIALGTADAQRAAEQQKHFFADCFARE